MSGLVFDDLNRNGRREAGEVGRGGQIVYLDLNHNGALDSLEPTTVTTANGAYTFDGLADGAYLVRLLVAPSQRVTTMGTQGLEVQLGGSLPATIVDFGIASRLINPIADQAVYQTGTLTVSANLSGATAAPLTYRLGPGAPEGVTIDACTGSLSWTPAKSQSPGSYAITVIAHDPFNTALSDSTTFHVHVLETLVPIPNMSVAVQYVSALYSVVLGRELDPAGLTTWVARLDAGASRLDVASAIWNSPEHRGIQVDAFYSTFLHRAPEPGLRASLVDRLLAGTGETKIAQSILTSPEYRKAHPTRISFLTGLYHDVLGRPRDREGLSTWMHAARRGVRRAAIARRFLTSREAYGRQVDLNYRTLLGREPDREGRAFWTQKLVHRQQNPSQVAEMFLASPEFLALAARRRG